MQAIEANRGNIAANKVQPATQKENIETNQQIIASNKQQIERNIKDIEENTNRFTALSECREAEATVNFEVGSTNIAAKRPDRTEGTGEHRHSP